jgi:hypothetical protein
MDGLPDRFVWQNMRTFTSLLRYNPHIRLAHSPRRNVAVIRRDMDFKIGVNQRFDEILYVSALRPISNLGMQPATSHGATVNGVVNYTDD